MNTFKINDLIQKGIESVQEYDLNGMPIFIRPLTDLEMQEASSKMFERFTDEELKAYMEKDDTLKSANVVDVMRANIEVDIFVAYTAMKDFADEEFDPVILKGINGIADLAKYVREISGYGEEVEEEVKEFRQKPDGDEA